MNNSKNDKSLLIACGILGALAVALGAFGAHSYSTSLQICSMDQKSCIILHYRNNILFRITLFAGHQRGHWTYFLSVVGADNTYWRCIFYPGVALSKHRCF